MVKSPSRTHIVVVDDDREIRQAVQFSLERAGYEVSIFSSAETCLKSLDTLDCNLLVTDVKMPGIDGFGLLARIKQVRPGLPVIMITGFGDIPMAIRAVQAGAGGFIEKPLDRDSLLQAVEELLTPQVKDNFKKGESLTQGEKRVLGLVLAGHSNREIAEILCRSIRTVEDHRRNIMHKLDAKNLVELVKVAIRHNLTTG